MNNDIYGKTMENLRNSINVKLLSSKKDYLTFTSNPSYMLRKIFDNNLVAIRKSKLALKLNKPAYIAICILKLSKVLMYEFNYDYIKNKYDKKSIPLFTETDCSMYEIKTEDVYKDFSSDKRMFDFSNYSTKSKHYDDSNKLVMGKMKNETGGVTIEEFVGLKAKMYSFLVDENSQHKKVKGENRNVVATIRHNEYKDVLLNSKCLRHSLNRIESKDHKTGAYEISKI